MPGGTTFQSSLKSRAVHHLTCFYSDLWLENIPAGSENMWELTPTSKTQRQAGCLDGRAWSSWLSFPGKLMVIGCSLLVMVPIVGMTDGSPNCVTISISIWAHVGQGIRVSSGRSPHIKHSHWNNIIQGSLVSSFSPHKPHLFHIAQYESNSQQWYTVHGILSMGLMRYTCRFWGN